MNKTTEIAPCKVNLYLDVTGLRADGYHGIESVMTTLPLCDEVTVTLTDGEIRVKMKSGKDLTDDLSSLGESDNLAYRAAKKFFEAAGIKSVGADIEILKRIPSRAGLGGGSSDAAATLRVLNRLTSYPFSTEELCKIGLSLGADVPFCVVGGTALCRGVGEEITPINNAVEFHGLITSERAEKKSTAAAYRAVDEATCSLVKNKSAVRMAKTLEAGVFDAVCDEAFNIFGDVCGYPDDARRLLKKLGAPFVLMSGAGPSVVALTQTREQADALADKMNKEGYTVFNF